MVSDTFVLLAHSTDCIGPCVDEEILGRDVLEAERSEQKQRNVRSKVKKTDTCHVSWDTLERTFSQTDVIDFCCWMAKPTLDVTHTLIPTRIHWPLNVTI